MGPLGVEPSAPTTPGARLGMLRNALLGLELGAWDEHTLYWLSRQSDGLGRAVLSWLVRLRAGDVWRDVQAVTWFARLEGSGSPRLVLCAERDLVGSGCWARPPAALLVERGALVLVYPAPGRLEPDGEDSEGVGGER